MCYFLCMRTDIEHRIDAYIQSGQFKNAEQVLDAAFNALEEKAALHLKKAQVSPNNQNKESYILYGAMRGSASVQGDIVSELNDIFPEKQTNSGIGQDLLDEIAELRESISTQQADRLMDSTQIIREERDNF